MAKIEDLLQKPFWKRRIYTEYTTTSQTTIDGGTYAMELDTQQYTALTQKDFMDELCPSAHKINSSIYRAMRRKYKFNTTTNKFEFDTYEDVERSPIAAQWGIRRHKVTATFGNDVWFGSLGKKKDEVNDELVATFKSYWEQTGMKDAMSSWGAGLFGTGGHWRWRWHLHVAQQQQRALKRAPEQDRPGGRLSGPGAQLGHGHRHRHGHDGLRRRAGPGHGPGPGPCGMLLRRVPGRAHRRGGLFRPGRLPVAVPARHVPCPARACRPGSAQGLLSPPPPPAICALIPARPLVHWIRSATRL